MTVELRIAVSPVQLKPDYSPVLLSKTGTPNVELKKAGLAVVQLGKFGNASIELRPVAREVVVSLNPSRGPRGVGIKSLFIDHRYHLIVELTDNTIIDAGRTGEREARLVMLTGLTFELLEVETGQAVIVRNPAGSDVIVLTRRAGTSVFIESNIHLDGYVAEVG